MATEVWPELTNIQDEDVLRKMWQETEDFGRKKEIRARMYKLREQRLKDFYTTGDTQTEVSLRKTKTHTESIGDQGSFLTMKTKEIRDSESPTRDISCTRREQKWTTSYGGDKKGTRSDNANVVRTQQIVSVEPTEIIESSTVTSGKTSSQRVAQSSSVQTSKVSSQSVQQSSKSEVRHSENTQVASGQEISAQSNVRQITSGNEESSLTSNVKTVTGETQSQRVSADSRTQQGGESVATTRTIKQSSSGGPEEIITTTVTTYTTSDKSQPPLKQTSVRVIKRDDQYEGGLNDKERDLSSVVETRTIVKSEPQITQSVSESVTRSQHVQQNQKSTYSTQSASSTVQKSSTSVEKQGQNVVSARISENQVYDSNNIQENVNKQTSNINNDLQRYVVQDTDITERRTVQDSRDQKVQKNDQVQITEVETYEQDRNVTNVQNRRDSRTDNKKQDIVKKTTDVVGSQRNVLIDDNITNKTQTNQQTSRLNTTNKTQNEQVHVKSSTSTTDQKILNEIQKLDTYLSTQPTPSNSVPISPQNIIDANWPVDKEFVYTDSAPRDNKVLVNGDRSTPVRHPTNLELPKGATDGQYVTTYQHDYSPRVSSDLSSNHQYFASTLRASPDRSSPSPSKRSSSKGSLDRSTPDRKFRASPSRKTPDHERRLSSSSYTIERISDNKRHATDVKEKSQTLPKDSSKPKRKLSSTQTKAANKTRVSTPGASPTSSPTRVQRPRKRSTSDSDSDHSNATFNKTTALRKTETDETKKYGSTTRIRGSSTSVNFTDAEGRPLSSPSPVRHPARENTPDYSSEGSITRELRTLRTEKPSNNFDSSPERSAFAPIKSFQTSPERKDQSLNMINEERRHILQAKTSSNVNISETVTERSTNSDVNDTRTSTIETRHLQTPDSRPERDSPDRISDVVDTERVKFTDQTSSDNKPRHTTPASSPERKVKKDKPESNRPLSYGRPSPDRKSTTPVSSPDRKSKSPLRSLDRKPKTPVGSPDRKTKTPISSPDRKPKTPISSPDRKPKTPISSPDRKPRTPISSPDRRSPTKQDRTSSERQSPTKPRYQSPVTTQKVPDYARPKTSSVVTEKASVVRKTTKTTEGDRITRRSSIPRAEVKYSSRPVREPDNKPKTSYTRETASSTTRVSTTRTSTSPALYQPKTSVTKSVDRTSFRDTKLSTPKKPESTGLKKPSSKPGQTSPVKFSPVDSTKPKTKTPIGSKRDIPIRTNETVAGRKDTVTKSSTTVKKDQDLKTTTKKTKKEITHTDSKEIINRKLKEQISVDKESNDSIDDEQPPEFFDEFDDRDETDRISTEKIRTDLTDFKHHETDHTIINTCDTRTTEKNITDTKVTHKVTDDSTKFITAEQSPSRPSKPGSVQSSTPKKKPDSNKPTKLKDTSKPSKKKPTGLRSLDDGSSSSSDEEEIIIKYDDYSDIKETDTHQVKITKRDASKANQVTDNSKNTLKVQVQHPKSSRESSPEKSIPLSVTSDGGQTPRYADFVIEPEDVEVFDSSNLGPNRPIPSTVLDENRIIEESDSSTRENEKVSVAERVSKYTEKTNKIDIVTLDTSRDQNNSSSDVSKTKELFENITKHHPEDNQTLERRGSKKFIDVNEFIKNESSESIRRSDVTTSQSTVDTVDKATITKREAVYQQTPVVQKPVTKKQPSSEDVLKKSERRLSEHAPDIESKKAFFEKKSKDTVTTETVKTIPISPKEPLKSASPFDQKVPHYMKDTETTVTRKESIQREFAPVRQGTETDMSVPSKEKRSSIDIEKMEEFIRSESYQVDKEAKTPIAHPVSVKDFINKRRSSTEVQELDTFKKAEAYILCEDRTRNVSEKRSSVDMQKNVITTVTKKEPTDTKRKPSLVKSPEPSPTRKASKDKSTDRVPLKKKDTNIMSEERVNETKTGKFGVTLRRTSTSGVTSTPKVSQPQVFLPDQLPEIEEIFDLIILEVLLTRAVLYDERRRIRAQIRIVKKNLESEQNQQPTRRPQTTTKSERGVKEETYQRKDLARIDRSSPRDRKHTPSPTKDTRSHDEPKKTGYRASPDRSVRTSVDRRDLQKGFEDKRTSSDKNGTTVTSVKNYTSPDKKYSIKETKTETRKFSASSPERRSTTTVETISRKSTPYPVMGGERKTSSYESRAESHSTYSRGSPERRTSETNKTGTFTRSPERRTVKEETNKTGTFTRTPTGTAERKTSSSFESRLESHSTYSRSSPERRTPDSTKTGTFTRSPERRIVREEETRKTDTFTRSPDRKPSKSSPERKPSYESRRTSETIKTTSRSSPERRVSKDQETRSYSSKTEERRSSETRKTSRTSPDRKYSSDYDSRKTSETRNYSRASPDRKLSTDTTETTRTSSQVHRSSAQYSTTTTSVGRKGEDSITSSYGVGPTDDQGRPLFGLRALRSTNKSPDEPSDIEVGEDVGDGLEDLRGSDGRPLFGLKAIKSVTTSSTTTTVTSSDMPSTQHLVQKHQQFLSEVKSSEEKVKGEAPRARLRDSFILDGDETGTTVVPALSHAQGVSLKSIIQKHEDMATTGKNVRREVQSTKTVTSSHGTVTSDGKVSLSKHIIHGEMRGKDGAEPTGRITTSQYSYKSPDDPLQKPHVTSTTTTTHLGASQRNSITSLGEVRIEEHKENDSRRDSLVSSARKSLESRQKEESLKQSESERKTIVRGDSIKALQHKFQQPTGVNQVNQKPTYPKAGLILRSNSLTHSDDQNHLSSSMKRTSGEERRSSVEERRSSIKDEREESTRTTSKTSTTSVTSSSTRRDSGSNLTSKTTTREGSKSATSFLDDTSKVTGVQDILQRMRNADLVTENNDTTEDAEARSLLNKFLGASVILQGMEAGGAGPASSALVSQVERQRILTSTQRKTDDIDEITDEKQLQILLEACCDYEQRRKIRARLRKIMADRKGGQGELVGGEDREERREEFSESRQITSSDGGSFTKSEVHKTSTSSARLSKANSVQQSPFAKFRQLERQNSAPSGGALFKLTDPKLVRSASTIKDRLLCWARAQTSGYKNVQIDNFSTSWSSGLAFCALIHHFYPDAFDYNLLTPESRRHNFELAFRIAEEKGDIYPLLDVEDMVAMRKPDWKCVFTYVQSIYRRMHNQPNAVTSF